MSMTKEELKIVLEEGEGYRIEFKARVSENTNYPRKFKEIKIGRKVGRKTLTSVVNSGHQTIPHAAFPNV